MTVRFPERAPARPIWLVTLADLALLLVGFFVLLQAHATDGRALASALRARFGDAAPPPPRPIAVAAAAIDGFAPGSAALPRSPAAIVAWARDTARDPRVWITVTGTTDGTAADVDPDTASAAVLATDRARALVAALGRAGVARRRLAVATTTAPGRRAATAAVGFTGVHP